MAFFNALLVQKKPSARQQPSLCPNLLSQKGTKPQSPSLPTKLCRPEHPQALLRELMRHIFLLRHTTLPPCTRAVISSFQDSIIKDNPISFARRRPLFI